MALEALFQKKQKQKQKFLLWKDGQISRGKNRLKWF